MILVDEGKVKVDDPVEKYLPEFKGQMVIAEKDDAHVLLKKPAHPIRVRDILSHTSGLAFKSPIEEPTLDLFPLATRVRSYAIEAAAPRTGTKYLYSNAGINTAGRDHRNRQRDESEDFLDERLLPPPRHEGHDILARMRNRSRGWRNRYKGNKENRTSRRRASGNSIIRSMIA